PQGSSSTSDISSAAPTSTTGTVSESESRRMAAELVLRWNHHRLAIEGEESEGRAERVKAVDAVFEKLVGEGYPAALALVRSMGRQRGVEQPWLGTMGGSSGGVEHIELSKIASGPRLPPDGASTPGPSGVVSQQPTTSTATASAATMPSVAAPATSGLGLT